MSYHIHHQTCPISIHAPSRERPPTLQHCNADLHFNPRSLAGATADGNSPRTRTLKFQSTLPHGSDNIGVKFRNNGSISIHAPSRERQIEVMSIRQLSIFQSSLPRGSDSPNSTALCSDQAFQSSLPRGSDSPNSTALCSDQAFQSSLPRGSDCNSGSVEKALINFNPRSLAGATYS